MMYRIAINGINSKAGGGRTILFDYIKHLDRQETGNRYFLLTTEHEDFDWISNGRITVVELPVYYRNTIFAPIIYELIIGNCLDKIKIDVVLNFGDLIINTRIHKFTCLIGLMPYIRIVLFGNGWVGTIDSYGKSSSI